MARSEPRRVVRDTSRGHDWDILANAHPPSAPPGARCGGGLSSPARSKKRLVIFNPSIHPGALLGRAAGPGCSRAEESCVKPDDRE